MGRIFINFSCADIIFIKKSESFKGFGSIVHSEGEIEKILLVQFKLR